MTRRSARAVEQVETAPDFSDLLPTSVDEQLWFRRNPVLAQSSPEIEAAEAILADLEERAATVEERRAAAIQSGDGDAVLDVLRDRETLPSLVHAAKIQAQVARSAHFHAERERIQADMPEYGERLRWLYALQFAVGNEIGVVTRSSMAAESVASNALARASEADHAARRLRAIDPTKLRLPDGPKREPVATGDTLRAAELWDLVLGGPRRQAVRVNGKWILRGKKDGTLVEVDGCNVRADGVLIRGGDTGEVVTDGAGNPRMARGFEETGRVLSEDPVQGA